MDPSTVNIATITKHLNEALSAFTTERNDAEIALSNGRKVKVANVLENKDGSFMVSELRTKGMFYCTYCDDHHKPGSSWTQISHGDNVIRLHDKQIHTIKEHPEHVPLKSLEKVISVLLG